MCTLMLVYQVSIPKAILYWICQLLGAILGVAMARGVTPSNEALGQINHLVSLFISSFTSVETRPFCLF